MKTRTAWAGLLAVGLVLCLGVSAPAGMVIQASEAGLNGFAAAGNDLINQGTPTFSSQSNVGGSLYGSYANGTGLNNGTIYHDGGYHQTENARTYCPANGSSITFDLDLTGQPGGYDIGSISSVSGGSQARRSQKFRLEVSTVGDAGFTTVADETQIDFVSNAGNGEMRVRVYDDTGAPLATGVDQVRTTYFNTGASLPQSMYRELDVLPVAPPPIAGPPAVTSANLAAHFNASDINNDGGASSPGDGNDVDTWTDLVGGMALSHNFPIDGKATFIAAGSGGIGNQDTVRFDATAAGGDLMFNNAMGFNAQTIFAVATMEDNGASLATLMSNQFHGLNVRQTTSPSASYFTGNSADFVQHGSAAADGGTISVDGITQVGIPGGFGAAHLIKAERNTAATFNGFRLSDNVVADRRWNGDIAEILVYDANLSADDTLAVRQYITDKYGLAPVAVAPTLPAVTSANVTRHLDAANMNDDGGATNPGDGNNITNWDDLVTGVSMNIQSTPSWHAAGLNGNPTVRFDGGPPYGDLVWAANGAIINTQAQTIFAVTAMTSDAYVLSNLISDGNGGSTIRQMTSETPSYYPGNSADFHYGGTMSINGNQQLTIPGGFGAAHAVKAISSTSRNIWSLRVGDNAHNRLFSGDVSEIIVFDGRLSGDDTLKVQQYLADKHGVVFSPAMDDWLKETKQIAVDPFGDGSDRHIGVNFSYGGPTAGGTFKGIGFDEIDLSGGVPPTGPFVLNANAATAGATLTLNFPFTSDNGQRTQSAGITGTDAATLNAIASEFFYIGGNNHPSAGMTFDGLIPDTDAFVQVLGGDSGWNGDLQVLINGASTADWLGVADGNGGTGSLFGFFATTDGSGRLQLDFSILGPSYAGIGGIFVTQALPETAAGDIPEPATMALIGLALAGLGGYVRRRRRA